MDRVRLFKAAAAAVAVLSLLLALTLGLSACGSGGAGAQNDGSEALAAPFSGPTLDGKQVSLEQYRGKPLILVFMTYT